MKFKFRTHFEKKKKKGRGIICYTSLQVSNVKSETPRVLKKSVASSTMIGRWRLNS